MPGRISMLLVRGKGGRAGRAAEHDHAIEPNDHGISGSLLACQVLVACQLIAASRRIVRTVSVLIPTRCRAARCSTSLDRLHVVNGQPTC